MRNAKCKISISKIDTLRRGASGSKRRLDFAGKKIKNLKKNFYTKP